MGSSLTMSKYTTLSTYNRSVKNPCSHAGQQRRRLCAHARSCTRSPHARQQCPRLCAHTHARSCTRGPDAGQQRRRLCARTHTHTRVHALEAPTLGSSSAGYMHTRVHALEAPTRAFMHSRPPRRAAAPPALCTCTRPFMHLKTQRPFLPSPVSAP